MKIVIFDLDETLGYFVEFGMFWDSLHKYISENCLSGDLDLIDFHTTLDLYPEFIRPNIFPILKYLKHKKESKCCNRLFIYTNNQGTDYWASKLISYFELKIKSKLFDQIISAFKINGKRMEICRSTHDKTYNDLIKCTKIPLNAEICYLDDTYYPEMSNQNVFYIHVKPYIHDLTFEDMISRFEDSGLGEKIIKKDFKEKMMHNLNNYAFTYIPKTEEENDLDKLVSKQIMIHLQDFFKYSSHLKHKKTKHKNGYKIGNKTKKRY
jgi:hypothetical protein